MGKLKGVVLDVDGTLVDSERDGHRPAFNQAFEELGLPYRWDEEKYGELLRITGGKRRLNAFFEEEGIPEEEREDLVRRVHERKTEIFQGLVADGRIPARPGVHRLLDELDEAGITMGVATTGSRTWVEPLLGQLFGLERFEAVVTGDDVTDRKPDPSSHRIALERMGVGGGPSVVAVEDSRNGLLAALAAELPCAIVVTDYTRDQDFTGAALVLDSFGEPDNPASVLDDPHGVCPKGLLDVETLAALAG